MKKKQVMFISGGSAYSTYEDYIHDLQYQPLRDLSDEDSKIRWDKQLRSDLGEEYQVFTPKMPNSNNAQYEEWCIWFERFLEYLHDNVQLIGWSLGASFLARYLTENQVPFAISRIYLLAAPFDYFVSEGSREDGGEFYPNSDKVKKLQAVAKKVYILHSKDDFVVPYEHALKYKEALPEAELITFADKNHFLVEELPELVEMIKGLE